MKKFWTVWNPYGRNPQCKHPTYDIAKGEAERLARNNPHETFYVMEALASATKADVHYERLQSEDDDRQS